MQNEWTDNPSNLVDLFENTVAKYPNRNFLGTKNAEGVYEWITYRDAGIRVDNLRGGLAKTGVKKNDAVGVIINNSIEWAVIAFATYGLNARFIPMYEKELEKVWKYIIKDSGVKILFVADEVIYEKVKDYLNKIKTLKRIYTIRSEGKNCMKSLEKIGKEYPKASYKPHYKDIAVLLYTSGTTGEPKGVLLSHENFISNIKAGKSSFPDINEDDVSFAILPWAHIFGQTVELYFAIYNGSSCGLMDTVETLIEDIPKVKPTLLFAVPRIFNKIYTGIHNLMREKGGISEKLFNKAKELAALKNRTGKSSFRLKILDKLVFSKIRAKLGGHVGLAITGGAVMNPEIAQFFIDVGIPTYDCYGLTETSPGITCNAPNALKLGTVGKAIKYTTVVIDKSKAGEDSEDGEILVFGPNVMQGYHNKPKESATAFVKDKKLGRGIRTGDRGKLDDDGFLYITGRFKEEYKLENGKYVHPASLEEDIKLNPYISNAMVYGEGKQYNVGLVVPDFRALSKYATNKGIAKNNPEELIKNSEIQKFLSEKIQNQLKGSYGGYEIPKKFIFISEDFALEKGFLTQTLKLKRRNVLKKYKQQLDQLYGS